MPEKMIAPPMVYISGEEMTREVMRMVLDKWITPYLDTRQWRNFDLSCKGRDDSNDQVLKDAIELKLHFPALRIRVYDAQEIPGTRSRADGANAIICQHRHHRL